MGAPQTPQEDGDDPMHFSVESADVGEKKLAEDASGTSEADSVATRFSDCALPGLSRDGTDRKRADDYREHLAAIVESSPDAIIGTDLNGAITSWNKGAEKIFGFTAAEMVGSSITRLIPEERQGESQHILEMLRRGERVENFETTRRTKDGRLVDVSIAASPIRDANVRIVGAAKIARDITVLKEREREIARVSRLFAALSQVNQTIIWATERDELFQGVCRALVEHGGMNLAWIGWENPETHKLVPVAQWGDDAGQLQHIEVYADDRPEGRGPSGLAFRSGQAHIVNEAIADPTTEPWRAELARRGVGALAAFPIRWKTKVCAMLCVYTQESNSFHDKEVALLEEAAIDVSFALDNFERAEARRHAERAVRNEKLFSDMMIESMPGILYFYDAKGRFLRWNRNFETVSGYSSTEIAGMHPLDFFSGEDRARVEERIAEVLAKGESSVEASFIAKDGRSTPYFFTGKRIVFEEMTCLVGVGIDITARRKAETALRVLNDTLERRVAARTVDLRAATERAEAADRLKSAFLATMSHELRTPLNSIIGFTGIMIQGLAGPVNQEQSKQLGMVRTSAWHLLALVNDVLDISKIEAGQLEVAHELFDVRQSITKVIALVTPLAEKKGLALRVEIAPALGQAESDERRFEQVLLNLLSNAIKFTERGEVVLKAELVADFHPEETASKQPAVCLQVSDTGMGIKPEDLPALFQPFRQIDTGLARNHEGTGLGLAICRRLAKLMGGKITVESVWEKGSTFCVTLPLKGLVNS
jgi:PAS domain S-box-containing protein